MSKLEKKKYFAPGHNACPGCSVPVGVRAILEATGEDVIVVTATGCLETISSDYKHSAWEVPWIHQLFENSPAIATGIRKALNFKGNNSTDVIAMGGDGASYDIGMGSLSGMFERDDKVLYICYDNEAYMNTGIQRSGATPYGASTATTPTGEISYGEKKRKKNLMNIALAHGVRYVASASVAYIDDLKAKVNKALEYEGATFIELLTPCNLGWGFEPQESIKIARLAVETGLFPLLEYKDGKLTDVKKFKEKKPVEDYLKLQKRFEHLFDEKWQEVLQEIKKIAEENVNNYELVK